MAVRRRRRRRRAVAKVTRRRRRVHRRRRTAVASNPPRRRRRRVVALSRRRSAAKATSRRRRHYRRNPSLGGIQRTIVEGVKDGATVFVAQVATRKIGAGINGMIPASLAATSPAIRGIGTRLAAAVAVAMIARRVAPGRAKIATAGAFAEVVNFAVAQSPTASKFLSAFPSRRVITRGVNGRGVRAWPQVGAGNGMSAWPMRSVGMPANVGNS